MRPISRRSGTIRFGLRRWAISCSFTARRICTLSLAVASACWPGSPDAIGPCRIRQLSPAAMARGVLPFLPTTWQRPRCSSTKAAATKPAPARIPMPTVMAYIARATYFSVTGDRTLLDLPQADLQQQLLVRVLDWACAPQAPLARLWYYPDAAPAMVLVNGDSDGMSRPQMEWYTNMVEAHGGEYTVYLMEQHLPHLTPEMERDYRQRGHSAGPHIWHSQKPTVEQMRTRIQEEVALFEERYGYPPKTTRHHCVIWPGWVETAKALADAGFRMDTNFRAGRSHAIRLPDRQRPADAIYRRGRRIHRVLRAGNPFLRRLCAGGQELPAAVERGAGHRYLQRVYRCRPWTTTIRWCICTSTRSTQPE